MSKIVPFPRRPEHRPVPAPPPAAAYEFTVEELNRLCRWYSAMKFAFPLVQGVMAVCPKDKISAVGLYGKGGMMPNCLFSKHESEGGLCLTWMTDRDPPRRIRSISEIVDAQIVAIAPPRNEAAWLDPIGWMRVLAERTIGDPSVGLGMASISS